MYRGFNFVLNEQNTSIISFSFLEGKTRSEISKSVNSLNGDSSAAMATVKNWFDLMWAFDEPHSSQGISQDIAF